MGVAKDSDIDVVDGSKNLLLESTLDIAVCPEDCDVLEVAVTVGINLDSRGVGR
jgi:hypothetical protein